MDNNLETTLATCKQVAERGCSMAKLNNDKLGKVLDSFTSGLDRLKNISGGEAKIPQYLLQYLEDARKTRDNLNVLFSELNKSLADKQSNFSLFNVVVYGRTMAGKSTLMETLTRGNGESIGKGAQRTTLDIRGYTWNGLTIFDTPGIAAAALEGREDERIAYQAAKAADLMVFMFTDDAVQQADAQAFLELKKLGKPIIVVINIKVSIPNNKVDKMVLRDLKKATNINSLDVKKNTFLDFIGANEIQRKNQKFIYANLHAAFLSQQGLDGKIAEELRNFSNIGEIEGTIVDEIINKGTFLQYKTFIDCTYKDTWEAVQQLQAQMRSCSIVLDNFKDGVRRLSAQRVHFEQNAQARISSFVQNLERELHNMANSFAHANYDNEDAGDDWNRAIRRLDIEGMASNLLQEIAAEGEDMLTEFLEEFQGQLRYNQQVHTEGIDGIKIVDFASNVRLGLGVLSLGLLFVNPVAALVVGILSFFTGWFESRESKIRKAINKMLNRLNENVDDIVREVRNGLQKGFDQGIIRDYLGKAMDNFTQIQNNLQAFYELQCSTRNELNDNLLSMNKQVLEEACVHLGLNKLREKALRMACIPGRAVLIEVEENTDIKDKGIVEGLSELLQVEVLLINRTLNIQNMVSSALGVDVNLLECKPDRKEILINNGDRRLINHVEAYKNLLEQLTDYVIICTRQVSNNAGNRAAEARRSGTSIKGGQKTRTTINAPSITPQLSWYEPERNLDDPVVQWDVAKCYLAGNRVGQSYEETFKWASRAAKGGFGKAQSFVGNCYYLGLGVELNYEKAKEWYEKAVESGYYYAAKYLGDYYLFGHSGTVDYKSAADWYEKAAIHDVPIAQFCLGNAFHFGRGRAQDDAEAAKWYERSALYRVSGAQNNLGCCYYSGLGKAQNYAEARLWFEKAKDQGYEIARINLQNLY